MNEEKKDFVEEEILTKAEQGYDFQFDHYLERGWELAKKGLGTFIAGMFTMLVVLFVYGLLLVYLFDINIDNMADKLNSPSMLISNLLITAFLFAPISAGFYILAHNVATNASKSGFDILKGYQFTLPIAVTSILIGLLPLLFNLLSVYVNPSLAILSIVISYFLSIIFVFANKFIVLKNYDFQPALEASWKLCFPKFFSFLGLFIVIILMNIAGGIFLGIGLFITIPLTFCIYYAAFEDIVLSSFSEEVEAIETL